LVKAAAVPLKVTPVIVALSRLEPRMVTVDPAVPKAGRVFTKG